MVDQATLKDILVFTRDGEWGQADAGPDLVKMRVIRGTDFSGVRVGEISRVPTRFIPSAQAERKRLQPRDILIETAGGTKDQPTGRTVLISSERLNAFGVPATCASFARILRVDPTRACPRYVFWWLQNLYVTGEMERHQVQHTGVARFQFTKFAESTSVPLPKQRIQEQIADLLGSLDAKIELNRQTNELLEAMAQALFKSWFVDFDPVRRGESTGLGASSVALFPTALEEDDSGAIPTGWIRGTFGDIAEAPRRGVQPSEVDPRMAYIGLEHMPRRSIALAEWGKATDVTSGKLNFVRKEILFGKLRPYFHKVGVAPVDGVCSTDILVITPRRPELFGLALCYAFSDAMIKYADATSTGTKMPRTSWGEISRFSVLIPPGPVARAFSDMINPLIEQVLANVHEERQLTELRDLLLPRLLSGELRVRDAERVVEASV